MTHNPHVSWSLYRDDPNTRVETTPDDRVRLVAHEENGDDALSSIVLSRKAARLMARRILECLDGTK